MKQGKICLPDYEGGSIVNLMSSIAQSFGAKIVYPPLRLLPSEELKKSRNIALIILDGIGFEYLNKKSNKYFLKQNLEHKITSVFPPTTTSAIPTFLTGTAPQQHAFTGWFTYLKEIGVVSKILPFSARIGGPPFSKYGFNINEAFNQKSFSEKIKAKSFLISPKELTNSDFTILTSKDSKVLGYKSLKGFFRKIKKAVKSKEKNKRKYIYAYWPGFDSLSHEYGVGSKKTEEHFEEIDKRLKEFVESIKNTDTTILITSDHGFINASKNKEISLKDHPKLKDCLTLPLCGEARTAYCYVHPSKAMEFEKYIKTKLNKFCYLYKSEELIKKNFFGLYTPNPKLFDRIGDYALLFKEDYIIDNGLDIKKKKKEKFIIGHHGGISKEEMYVPLIILKTPATFK
ncbi:MAG: alkaline phosphatase family protein [Nanoarchaeota archaeon]|nr:alkaline phosphatase family protein [Nanoarchaeota archaeon]